MEGMLGRDGLQRRLERAKWDAGMRGVERTGEEGELEKSERRKKVDAGRRDGEERKSIGEENRKSEDRC